LPAKAQKWFENKKNALTQSSTLFDDTSRMSSSQHLRAADDAHEIHTMIGQNMLDE
jgi:hypothetical protein